MTQPSCPVEDTDDDRSSPVSPRKRLLLDSIRLATAEESCCQQLLDIRASLPENFPQPDTNDVRLFHMAVQENSTRLIAKLMSQFPTIVLHSHFNESPLITAIRCGWEELAIHLVEHGAPVQCTKLIFDTANDGVSYDWYEVSAREMAYEKRMLQLLEIIDFLTGNYFPFLKPPSISIRMLRPVKQLTGDADCVIEIPDDFFTDSYVKPRDKTVQRKRPMQKQKQQQQQQQKLKSKSSVSIDSKAG